MRNDTGHQLCKFDTNRITNSKMADKMAAVFCKGIAVSQAFIFHFKWYSLLHFAVCQLLCWAFLSLSVTVYEIFSVDICLTLALILDSAKVECRPKYTDRRTISDILCGGNSKVCSTCYSFRDDHVKSAQLVSILIFDLRK